MSKNLISLLQTTAILFFAVLCCSCAHVDVYSDPEMKTRAPLKFYADADPYLLVTKNKDGSTNGTVIYLKDPKSARYLVQHNGWGTANLTFGVSNGVLTSYGMATDSKGPDTITSIGSLLTAGGGLATAIKALDFSGPAGAYADACKKLKSGAQTFKTQIQPLHFLKPDMPGRLSATADTVSGMGDTIAGSFNPTSAAGKSTLDMLKLISDTLSTDTYDPKKWVQDPDADAFNNAKTAFADSISVAITEILSGEQQSFDLYRIIIKDNGVSLVKIPVQ